ncbi:MAG TPA: hypothetical protein VLI04_17475 [Nocardioidaceae bacterium]|nr:hypothetical protein [Nocardioidaceae bacterium]
MPALRFAYAQGAIVAVLFAAALLELDPWPTLITVGIVTMRYASRLPEAYAVVLGLVAWAFYTGFVTNAYGLLTFDDADLARLALLMGVSAAAHWTR